MYVDPASSFGLLLRLLGLGSWCCSRSVVRS